MKSLWRTAATAVIGIGVAASSHYFLRAQDMTMSVWDGVYTDAQSKRGGAAYSDECASCHGPQLTGGESAPPLAGGEFLSNWNGLSVGELFERIRKTMPENNPGKLSREKTADILAFMFSANQFPSGKAELPPNAEMLKTIRIDAQKPPKK